mgnify:FL=1|tara:strand:- start:1718 stop:2341 length:624 start_codon:yes stop_codon:yes gene_type:complete
MAQLDPKALEEYNPFQGPIPGQSLTNSEDSQQPWEQPPRITNVKEARETVFLEILKEENLTAIVNLLDEGMSVAKITEMLLFIGFSKGEFNADMMLLLAEPTMYMLLAIAEAVGIDPAINDNDAEDEELEASTAEENEEVKQFLKIREDELRNPKALENLQDNLARTEIPQEIQKRVEEVDFSGIKESLLSKPTKEENTNDSLLQRK